MLLPRRQAQGKTRAQLRLPTSHAAISACALSVAAVPQLVALPPSRVAPLPSDVQVACAEGLPPERSHCRKSSQGLLTTSLVATTLAAASHAAAIRTRRWRSGCKGPDVFAGALLLAGRGSSSATLCAQDDAKDHVTREQFRVLEEQVSVLTKAVFEATTGEEEHRQRQGLEEQVQALTKELAEARAAVRVSQENAMAATQKLAEAQLAAQELQAEKEGLLAEIEALKQGSGLLASDAELQAQVESVLERVRSGLSQGVSTLEAAPAAQAAAASSKTRAEDQTGRTEASSTLEAAPAAQAAAASSKTRAGDQTARTEASSTLEATPAAQAAAASSKTTAGDQTARTEAAAEPAPAPPAPRTDVPVSGHYWTLPPQRYEFKQERPLSVGSWRGVEQVGEAPKVGKARACHFYRVPALLQPEEARQVLAHVSSREAYDTELDSVDRNPTFEYYPFQQGEWVDEALGSILRDAVETRVLPYIRERYGVPHCALDDILVRRYVPGERRTHAVHFDGHAFVTAVLGLSDPDEYEGGLYVQPGPDVASRTFFRIEPGDLIVHSFDLQHGVHVWKGTRYSMIFWIKDSPKAVKERTTPWYDELAAEGDADASYNLAMNYSSGGSGKPVDIPKAIELYERSAQAGHYLAQNNLGTLYMQAYQVMELPEGLQKFVYWLTTAADAGYATAQRNLAQAYLAGDGVEKSQVEGAKWMRKSAEQLDVEAAYLLANIYREGRGVHQDLNEAAVWYRRSAQAGFPQAQYTLGVLHMEGEGVEKDEKKAEAWFHYAAKQDVDEAKNNLAALFARRGDIAEAAEIWSELAVKGEPNAQCNIGMCYMRGLGKTKNMQEAREWLRKAAVQGHRMAQSALTEL